jgi:hypothetical protein
MNGEWKKIEFPKEPVAYPGIIFGWGGFARNFFSGGGFNKFS